MRVRVLILCMALFVASCGTAGEDPPGAQIILYNGTVVTLDGRSTVAEAVALSSGRILAVGSRSALESRVRHDTKMVDLEGRTVLPGFVDPHIHYLQRTGPDVSLLADQQALLSWGRTTVGLPTVSRDRLGELRRMGASLRLRVHVYVPWNSNCGDRLDFNLDDYTFDRSAELRLAVAGVKVFMDGGSCRGPAVSFNFNDAPPGVAPPDWTNDGDLFVGRSAFAGVVTAVNSRGGQVVAHAIGDRAIEEALRGYETALAGGPNPNGHRIDHVTFIRPELQGEFARLNIPAVVWGVFMACAEPDQGWASFLTAEQLSWLRRHRMLLDEVPPPLVAFHSDAPATNGDPFHQLLGLTEMAQVDGATGGECSAPSWLAGHGVTVPEALRMMTIWPARVMGIADAVGSIEPGKYADLVVLQRNPLDQRGFDLLNNRITATIANGEAVWCDPSSWCDRFR